MNFSPTWILSVSLLLVGFLGIVLSAVLFSKPIDDDKFSFMRNFPFEAQKHSSNGRFFELSTYLFSIMCFSPLFVYQDVSFEISFLNETSIFISCAMGLAAVAFIFLVIFDATHTKTHIYLFGLFVLLTFFSSVLIFVRGVVGYSNYLNFGKKEPIFIVCEVLSALITIFILLVAFNPKLSNWAKLEKSAKDSNEYVRPKKFALAYSEWAILLALMLNELTFFIELLI